LSSSTPSAAKMHLGCARDKSRREILVERPGPPINNARLPFRGYANGANGLRGALRAQDSEGGGVVSEISRRANALMRIGLA